MWEKIDNRGLPYKIIKIGVNSNNKFKSFFDIFNVKIVNPHEIFDVDNLLLEIALRVIKERGLQNGDKIQWIVSHITWRKPVSTKLITITDQLGVDMVEQIAKYIEYKEVPITEVKIEIRSVKIPRGKGHLRVTKLNASTKKSIITIKNNDSICLARSIVTAVANINKHKWTTSQLKHGFNDSRKLQKDEVIKLHEEAGVEINDNGGSTLEDVKKFAKHLNGSMVQWFISATIH